MPHGSAPNSHADADQLEAAVDQAIAACGGDMRATIRALIVATEFLESQNRELSASISPGYLRTQLPPDRKDWYD
jgi:hypothetical protein